MSEEFDIIVAGAGIAGLSAALTAARLGRRTMVLSGDVPGGQLLNIEKIDGYPGFPDGVPGYDLCPIAQEQAQNAGAEFSATTITGLTADGDGWSVATGDGVLTARGVVLATGAQFKPLGVPGEERLKGKGVSECATCDGPLLKSKVVAVVGGGDSAMQEALTLANFASKVVMLHLGDALAGQGVYRDAVTGNGKIELRPNSTVAEILGDEVVTGVRVKSGDGGTAELAVSAVFPFIGLHPSTAFLDGGLALDNAGAILTDAAMRTRLKGVCAAGAVRAGTPGRAAGAAGEGASAAIALDRYLTDGAWPT